MSQEELVMFASSSQQTQRSQQPIEPLSERIGNILLASLRFFGSICYISCPPVPELVTRKLAFLPPGGTMSKIFQMPKMGGYRIQIKDREEIVDCVSKLAGRKFEFSFYGNTGIDMKIYRAMKHNILPFTVRTRYGNLLVGVRCRPKNGSFGDQVVIFAQPNATDLSWFLSEKDSGLPDYAEQFSCDVYGFDYSGYGCSTGTPSEKNIYSDIAAVYRHVRKTQPDKKIVLIGFSIGTTAVTDLAATNPEALSGVVLMAPLSSALRLVLQDPNREHSRYLDRFTSIDKIGDINVPVLIAHGKEDQMIMIILIIIINVKNITIYLLLHVIPVSHSLALHNRLRHPVAAFFLDGADHSSIASYCTTRKIRRFIENETTEHKEFESWKK